MIVRNLFLVLLILFLVGCSKDEATTTGACGKDTGLKEFDLIDKFKSVMGHTDIPREKLLLFDPAGNKKCLVAQDDGVLSTVDCDHYNKAGWWYRHASSEQLIHFSSKKCLTKNNANFTLVDCGNSTTMDFASVSSKAPNGNFFHTLEMPLATSVTFSCQGKDNLIKFDKMKADVFRHPVPLNSFAGCGNIPDGQPMLVSP